MNHKDAVRYCKHNPVKVSLGGVVAALALVLTTVKGCGMAPVAEMEFESHVGDFHTFKSTAEEAHRDFIIEQRIQHEDIHDVLHALGQQPDAHGNEP